MVSSVLLCDKIGHIRGLGLTEYFHPCRHKDGHTSKLMLGSILVRFLDSPTNIKSEAVGQQFMPLVTESKMLVKHFASI